MPNSEIFKSNFLNNLNAVTLTDMLLAIALAFLVGLFIHFVYYKVFRGVTYSSSFGFTLMALTAISTVLMLAVTSNVMLSLGMVGALSIVRFRTAIKDPMEIAFLFWSIEAGIVLAAGILPLAILGNTAIGVFFILIAGFRVHSQKYMLVVRCNREQKDQVEKTLKGLKEEKAIRMELKGMTPRNEGSSSDGQEIVEIDWEITIMESKKQDSNQGQPCFHAEELLTRLKEKHKDVKVSLVRFNGSYTI